MKKLVLHILTLLTLLSASSYGMEEHDVIERGMGRKHRKTCIQQDRNKHERHIHHKSHNNRTINSVHHLKDHKKRHCHGARYDVAKINKDTVTHLESILQYHVANGVRAFSDLDIEKRKNILKTAALLVVRGRATFDTDALIKALGQKHTPTLRTILEYHIGNGVSLFKNLSAREKETLLLEAGSLILSGQATPDTDALTKVMRQKYIPHLRTVLEYHIGNGVSLFKNLSASEKETLLLEAGSLILSGQATPDTDALIRAMRQKHIPHLRTVLEYHIGNGVPVFTKLSLAQKEILLLKAGSLVVNGQATLDTDALTKSLG